VLALLLAVNILSTMDRVIFSVLVTPMQADLRLSDAEVGLLAGLAFALSYALLGLPFGRVADRRPRVPVLAGAITVWSLMTALCGIAQNVWQMLFARIGVGSGEAGCVPAAVSLIGDYFPGEKRVMALSVFQAGALLGSMGGLMLGGVVADQFGWRAAFLAFGIPGLLLAAAFLFTVREPVRMDVEAAASGGTGLWRVVGELLRLPAYRNVLIALSFASFAGHGMAVWMPTYFGRVFGLSLSVIGIWSGLANGVGGLVGVLGGGWIATRLVRRDRRWEVWFPALCYTVATPVTLLMLAATTSPVAFGLQFACLLATTGGLGASLSSIQSTTPGEHRSTAIAVVLLFSSIIGLGAAPFGIGVLNDLLSHAAGQDMLRVTLSVGTLLFLVPAVAFALAGRAIGGTPASRGPTAGSLGHETRA
jgi:MFS family permease